MLETDKKPFAEMLATTFTVYGRQAPDSNAMRVWFRLLAQFDLQAVQRAFDHYVATEPKFPPTPAGIRDLLGANQDHRLSADEAWALALTSIDEAETVVWTNEIAEAFGACRAVLDAGDKIGARMAFRDAYTRITDAAKQRGERPEWLASLGFDPDRREQVLRQATESGLLPAQQVAALLPPPETAMTPEQEAEARSNTARLKAMLEASMSKPAGPSQAEVEARETAQRKAEVAAKVKAYEAAHGSSTVH